MARRVRTVVGASAIRVVFADKIRARTRFFERYDPFDGHSNAEKMAACLDWAASTRADATGFPASLLAGLPVVLDRSSMFTMLFAADDSRWKHFTAMTGEAGDLFELDEADRIHPYFDGPLSPSNFESRGDDQ